jgi:hypothetical protein
MSDSRAIAILGGSTKSINPEIFYIRASRKCDTSPLVIQTTTDKRYPKAKQKKNAHLTARKG